MINHEPWIWDLSYFQEKNIVPRMNMDPGILQFFNTNFQIQSAIPSGEVPEKMGHHLDLFQHDLTKRSK